MSTTAKIFMSGRSQAVRLPRAFRFSQKEVFISRDLASGNIILSQQPNSWDGLFDLDKKETTPADFMSTNDRGHLLHNRDPFDGYAQ